MSGTYTHTYEEYDRSRQTFIPTRDLTVITILDILSAKVIDPKTPRIFCDLGLYDIQNTVVCALRNLAARYPNCYARVYQSPRYLEEIAAAHTGAQLLVEASLAPMNLAPGSSWPKEFLPRALEAGCDGAIVDSAPTEILESFPEAIFFRRVTK